ncbi:DUF2817 domain-containing protein [Bradyrhizobium elkanii]
MRATLTFGCVRFRLCCESYSAVRRFLEHLGANVASPRRRFWTFRRPMPRRSTFCAMHRPIAVIAASSRRRPSPRQHISAAPMPSALGSDFCASGTHGQDGRCGSAAQLAFLQAKFRSASVSTAVLCIRAQN